MYMYMHSQIWQLYTERFWDYYVEEFQSHHFLSIYADMTMKI